MIKILLFAVVIALGYGIFETVKMNVDFKAEVKKVANDQTRAVAKAPVKYEGSYIGNAYEGENAILKKNIFSQDRSEAGETQTNKEVKLVGLCSMGDVKGAIIQEKVKETISARSADRLRDDRRAMMMRMFAMMRGGNRGNRGNRAQDNNTQGRTGNSGRANFSGRNTDPSRYVDRNGKEKQKTVNKLNDKRFFIEGDTLENGFTLTKIDFEKGTVTIVKGNERFVLGLEAGDPIKITEQKTKIIVASKVAAPTKNNNNNNNAGNNRNAGGANNQNGRNNNNQGGNRGGNAGGGGNRGGNTGGGGGGTRSR